MNLSYSLLVGRYLPTNYALAITNGNYVLEPKSSVTSNGDGGIAFITSVICIVILMWTWRASRRSKKEAASKMEEQQRQLEQEQEAIRKAEEQRRLELEEAERQSQLQLQAVEKEKLRQEAKRKEVLKTVVSIVNSHAATLYRKKLQKVKHDDYGNTFDKEWQAEKIYFHKFTIWPRLLQKYPDEDLQFFNTRYSDSFIESAVYESTESLAADDIDVDRLRPVEFEIYCASLLKKGGWTAHLTKASGDQGIDIIAERDSIKLVFQVKKSSSPVGNKAVQEAIAGKAFVNANAACVVSNAEFTAAAKELANVSGIKLLHYSELTRLKIVRKQAS
jgi:restriction system protein